MTTTKTLTPPEVGELVGLHDEARVTGDFNPIYQRLAELHAAGYAYRILGNAIGTLPSAARLMAQRAVRENA